MHREIIFDVSGLTLWYYPISRVIHHQMDKYPGTETLEASLNAGLELMRTRRARKWLSDDRNGGALPKSHHEWGQKVWGPKAASAGWKYWALLPPEAMLGSVNMLRLVEIYKALGVVAKTFPNTGEAMDWLTRCK
jgi:hypothetical protein